MTFGPTSSVAQGSPSLILLPVCGLIGFVFLSAGVVAAIVAIKDRPRRGSAVADPLIRPARRRWAQSVALVSICVFLLCVGMMLLVLESRPTHAWRSFTRTNVLLAVDAATGKPVPIDVKYNLDVEDPYLVISAGSHRPDEWEVDWNVNLSLTATSPGFQDQIVNLSDSLPKRLVLRFVRSIAPPATHPT